MTAKEELAALKHEVEELKAKLSPPKPFVPQPHQQYDPTAGMCMPPSALAAMVAAVPSNFMRDVVRDNRAPSTRSPVRNPVAAAPPMSPAPALGGHTKRLSAHLLVCVTSMRSLMHKMRRIVPNLSNVKSSCRRRRK